MTVGSYNTADMSYSFSGIFHIQHQWLHILKNIAESGLRCENERDTSCMVKL